METESRSVTAQFHGSAPAAKIDSATDAADVARKVRLCRIERWRGYVSSTFYALIEDGSLLESRPFRFRRAVPPADQGAARAAYDDLVARLAAEGWSRYADGPIWYATTFAKPVAQFVANEQRAHEISPRPSPSALLPPAPLTHEAVSEQEQPAESVLVATEPTAPDARPMAFLIADQ